MGFRPTGATHWSNKREIWHGAADRTAALPWQISKIRILPTYLPIGADSSRLHNFLPTYLPIGADSFAQFFYEILSICTRLQVAFNLLIWPLYGHKQPSYQHFPAVWAFSHRFSIASSGKNYWSDPKNGTDLLYHHAKYSWDRGSRAGCKRKSVMFFCCFFVTLSTYEVYSNGKAVMQCNFQNKYGAIAHSYSHSSKL